MTENDSRAIGVRIKTEDIVAIGQRAKRRGWSFNRWVNWAISIGLRSHKKGANKC